VKRPVFLPQITLLALSEVLKFGSNVLSINYWLHTGGKLQADSDEMSLVCVMKIKVYAYLSINKT
jgi:hypothetical protein